MADENPKGEMPETPASETPANVQETQEEPFDKERAMATIEKLRGFEKEAEKLRKVVAASEEAERKRKEAEMSELEKAQKRAEEAEQKAAKLERQALQQEIAAKVGLPAKLASRLQGETPEEMEADAKEILETLPKPAKPSPGIVPTNPGANGQAGETDAQLRQRLNPTFSDLDRETARRMGGGVYFTE